MPDPELAAPREVFPFVVGCQRSGTTLLQALLDGHPDLAMAPEAHFVVPLAKRFANRWHPGPATNAAFAGALAERRRFEYWRLSEGEVLAALADARPIDFAGAVRTLFATWARRSGKPGYGDKTPRNVGHVRGLAELFPEARFVHLIRDGRDVALSMAEAFERGPQTAVEAALFWRSSVEAGRAQGGELGPGRYLEIRYEDLVAGSAATLADVAGFLGLGFHDDMVKEHATAARRIVEAYPDASVHPHLGLPIATRRDWRATMPQPEVARFELIAGELLAELGYERTTGDVEASTLERRRLDLIATEMIGLRRRLFGAKRRADRLEAQLETSRGRPWNRLARRVRSTLNRSGARR